MKKIYSQAGVILPTLMISTVVVFAVVLVVSQTVVDNYKSVLGEQHRVNAQFAADSGIDYAITQINQDTDWTGTSELELYDNGDVRTTYEVVVTDIDDDSKLVEVSGRTYAPASATEPSSTRDIAVELYSVGSGNSTGGASVVTGVGGLVMTNSAKIVAGNVYVNGTISMTNTAQIGTTTSPVTVRAAHQSCPVPANATYPQVCGSGSGQPITATNSARIYGDVQATNQTNGSFMTNPGLSAGTPAPLPLPTHDRAAQIAAVANTMTAAAASCSSGSRNIPANTRITGNVNWTNTCDVTLNGDVYVTGNVSISNSAEIFVAESVGATANRPDIMIDGSNGLNMSNNSTIHDNSFNTGVRVITYRSAASCSPNCANVTGTDLYNSRNLSTISLNNNASAPQTIFFAKWSQVNIVNSGDIGALIGQTVRLNNSAAVVFGASIDDYVTPGDLTWLVYSYRQD